MTLNTPTQQTSEAISSRGRRAHTKQAPAGGQIDHAMVQRALQSPTQMAPPDVLALQRGAGNQVVQRILQSSSNQPIIQRSLTVGPAGDAFEQEADRIADSVVSGTTVQRDEDEHRETPALQRTPIGAEGGAVSADLESRLRSSQSSGSSLPGSVRSAIEPKLGADLSPVKVHTDSNAAQLSRDMGAKAFTHRNHIYYGAGQSPSDLQLTAHEAVHTIQQGAVRQAPIQRVISKDEGGFGETWGGTDVENEANTYLTGLSTKKTDRGERREQKAEIKEMKGLLHFAKKDTTTSTEEQRKVFRAVLTAERARGQSMEALWAFKAYMIQYPDLISAVQYKKLLQNNPAVIKSTFLSYGRGADYRAPRVLLDLYHSHNPAPVDETINGFETEVNEIVPKANELSGRSTQTALIQLRQLTPRVTAGLQAAKQARANGEYELALQHVKETKELLEVVWQLYTYGQMSAKSSLSTEKESGEAKRLGGGQVSKVYEVNYKPELNPSIQHGVFKQETRSYDSGSAMGAKESGISTVDANFGSRSVASYKVDELLGVGMTPKTEFGTHKGMGGTVQDWAKGSSPQEAIKVGQFGDMTTKYREFDYSDPELQRQLSTLQLLDAITGQVDRHPGNYYIYQGPEGTQVTAIDNDLAFGANKDVEQLIDPVWNRPIPEDQSRGVPLFVDETVAEQILNTTPKDLKDTISGMLTEAEITKTLARFAKVKTELRKKKSNTARIKTMQQKVDIMTKYAGKFGTSHARVEEGLDTQIHFYKNQIAKLFSEGALIDRSEWGEKTAQFLNRDNSYFGVLVDSYEMHKMMGKTIPKDD